MLLICIIIFIIIISVLTIAFDIVISNENEDKGSDKFESGKNKQNK